MGTGAKEWLVLAPVMYHITSAAVPIVNVQVQDDTNDITFPNMVAMCAFYYNCAHANSTNIISMYFFCAMQRPARCNCQRSTAWVCASVLDQHGRVIHSVRETHVGFS
jgi:hypothetical protein